MSLQACPLYYCPCHRAAWWWWWCRGRRRAELPHPRRGCPLHPAQTVSLLPPARQRWVMHQGILGAQCQRQKWDLMPPCSGVAGIAESVENSRKRQLPEEAEGEHLPAVALPVRGAERATWVGGGGGTGTVLLAGVWRPAVPPGTSHRSLPFGTSHPAK